MCGHGCPPRGLRGNSAAVGILNGTNRTYWRSLEQRFVSGHRFSDADEGKSLNGFSPWGLARRGTAAKAC
jgi:hypothetical protein